MKGNLSVGNKVYRIESTKLNKSILPSFKEDKNFKKVSVNGEIVLEENKPIAFKVWSNDGFYNGISYTSISSSVVQKALNMPITKKRINFILLILLVFFFFFLIFVYPFLQYWQ